MTLFSASFCVGLAPCRRGMKYGMQTALLNEIGSDRIFYRLILYYRSGGELKCSRNKAYDLRFFYLQGITVRRSLLRIIYLLQLLFQVTLTITFLRRLTSVFAKTFCDILAVKIEQAHYHIMSHQLYNQTKAN